MAVTLYRKGATHNINGISCEMGVFNEHSFTHLLEDGWCFSPEACYQDETTDEEVPEDEPTEDIRARAKAAGISHWWTKSTDNLKKELADVGDES